MSDLFDLQSQYLQIHNIYAVFQKKVVSNFCNNFCDNFVNC